MHGPDNSRATERGRAPSAQETAETPAAAPLGVSWTIATVAIGVFAALIAIGGMTLSFRAVSAEMIPAFGAQWAWLVPLVIDFTVLVFSGVDLVLARRAIPHPLARITVYGATAGTVWLNYGAGGNLVGRIAHILMPSIWVMFVELMRHVVRHEADLVGTSLRQPIPAARWLLSPWPTAKLWRRMILWQVNSYTVALAHERERLRAVAVLREKHGRLWRIYTTPLVRLELTLGPTGAVPAGPAGPGPATAEPGSSTASGTVLEPSHATPADGSTEPIAVRSTEPSAPVPPPRSAPRPPRSRAGAPKRSDATVTSIVANRDWPAMAKQIVAERGPDVYLSVIQARLGCSKSAASRLRGEAVAAIAAKPADDADTEPERGMEAS